MAGAKKALPAPIDRPLSRAYLREFAGWSTAYPPGVSDPTSLRLMENVQINREGSVRIRPGLRMISERDSVSGRLPALDDNMYFVGSQEPFYLNDGRLAYLAAILNDITDQVEFRVLILDDLPGIDRWILVDLDTFGIAFDVSAWAPGVPHFTTATTYVRFLQIDNKILALSNAGEPLIVFYVGATKKVAHPQSITEPTFTGHGPSIYMTTNDWVASAQTTTPPQGVTAVPETLTSTDYPTNIYNYAFWYTFENELGESAPCQPVSTKLSRPLGGWLWKRYTTGLPAGANSVPNMSLDVTDPKQAADQLILMADPAAFASAKAAGATKLNFYVMSWSDQAPVPVEGQLIATKDITPSLAYGDSWTRMTPGSQPLGRSLPIPTADNGFNSTDPSRASQGLVASDRIVLVGDPTNAARIVWSSNRQGDYLDMASAAGGGYKTLTSGNMQLTAAVKLWQNPQSADTLTILCKGTDGYSSTYYMAPASVSSQSDNTQIMGFEETTGTPGTTSPYGCEVANNALFHPLDDQLMKSTASNYNINHKSQTDQIANMWQPLLNKHKIVSCFFDQRIYFLVHNPAGAALEPFCMGNEVWVLDLAGTNPTWSRWLTQGVSLRKAEVDGRLFVSLTRPDGIFVFDETRGYDEYVAPNRDSVLTRNIAWRLETNTQGANRAHDAWAHLAQVNLTLGNFQGSMRYGVRGVDQHGKLRVVAKKTQDYRPPAEGGMPYDGEDMLLVKKEFKEWYFFAESYERDEVLQPSFGQLNLVQYRYTPVSVNIGYEQGSIETFEYGRDVELASNTNTVNGVTVPMADVTRP